MPSRSNESLSLVHERCVKCGQLLPCALHDRELKRAILSERNEEPTFEKVWEGEGVAWRSPIIWTSESRFFAHSENGYEPCLGERDGGSNEWRIRNIDAWPIVGHSGVNLPRLISSTQLTSNKILLNYSNGRLVLLDPHERTTFGFEMTILSNKHNTTRGFCQLLPQADGSCLALSVASLLTGRNLLFRLKFHGTQWLEEVVFDPYEHMQGRGIEYLEPLSDGRLLAKANGLERLYILMPPADSSAKWDCSNVRTTNGGTVRLIDPHGITCLPENDKIRFVVCFETCLYLFQPDQQNEDVWEMSLMAESTSGMKYSSAHPLTADSLLAGTVDGTIDLLTRESDGSWKVRFLAHESGNKVDMFSHAPSDPNGFMVQRANGCLAYYRMPLDELHAYHERCVARTKTASLPPEI